MDSDRNDRGDTLIEVLVAIVIIGLAATAIMGSLLISINASGQHRYLANDDTLARSALEQVKQQVELPALQSNSRFIQCSTSTVPPSSTPPTGNAQVILKAWTTLGGNYNLMLPIPYSGYTVAITSVTCITATPPTEPPSPPSPAVITPDNTCSYSSLTGGVQTSCSSDNSGLLEVGVTVQDPSGYTVTMSTLVRDPTYQAAYATNY